MLIHSCTALLCLLVSFLTHCAGRDVNRPRYEVYEDCLANLPVDQWDYTQALYNQSICLGRAFDGEVYERELFQLIPSNESNITQLPDICRVGSTVHTSKHMQIQSSLHPSKCQRRSYSDRSGFQSKYVMKGATPVIDLFDDLARQGIDHMILIGDSVMQQMNAFLVCDAIREGIQLPSQHIADLDKELDKMIFYTSQHDVSMRVTKIRPHLDRSRLSDSTALFKELYESLLTELQEFISNSIRDRKEHKMEIVLFNYGLHLQLDSLGTHIPPMARALYDLATTNDQNMLLLLRETTAQHFSTVNGLHGIIINADGLCCKMIDPNHGISPVDLALMSSLSAIDQDWRNKIGWVKAHEATSKLFDLHTEIGKGVDCTHFVYAPHMLHTVWKSIGNETTRLLNLRQANDVITP
jgi:hypothetical protein